jgi:hypothetical protein
MFTSAHDVAWADETGTHDASASQSEPSASSGGTPERKDPPASSVGTGSPSGSTAAGAKTDSKTESTTDQKADKDTADPSPAKARDDDADDGTTTEPKGASEEPTTKAEEPGPTSAAPTSTAPTSTAPTSTAPTSTEPQPPATAEPETPKQDASTAEPAKSAEAEPSASKKATEPEAADVTTAAAATTTATSTKDVEEKPAANIARLAAVTSTPETSTLNAAAVQTTAVTPGPVSPISEIAALPGRIVNAVLQVLGMTTSAGTGQSPFSPAPIADLVFAVFRRIEEVLGLHAPVVQSIPPTMVYNGPLDVATPTVKQFLDAATTEYVLGGTPGGMVPFTVNGWPMTSLHLETGSDASVWVTPENQIIIAYSGTTGGTNLLFNPLIAVTQIITDLEAGLGNTTPLAFTQAVDFANAVKAEAAAQGYSSDDVFVTGHSLGAWQAQYVAQQIGLNGIGFEGPGLNSVVPGNGADSLFVNIATYGDIANFLASDLPGLSPIAPEYVPGGGAKPHYGPIVLLGDPSANTAMVNAANLWGKGIVGTLVSVIDLFGNFMSKHLPGVQAYHLDIDQDPGVVPWLGIKEGPVYTGFGDLSIPELLKAASDKGILVQP